jgi:hypothetical protein
VALHTFRAEPSHPWSRLLAPFIHRSVQVTNQTLDLLFASPSAGMHTLAPLPVSEQLRLLKDNSAAQPASIKQLHMDTFAADRGMAPFSAAPNATAPVYFWRWHYRARTVQRLFEEMSGCWIDANAGGGFECAAFRSPHRTAHAVLPTTPHGQVQRHAPSEAWWARVRWLRAG